MPEKGDPEDLPEVKYLEHSSNPQTSTHISVSRMAVLLCLYVATCVYVRVFRHHGASSV